MYVMTTGNGLKIGPFATCGAAKEFAERFYLEAEVDELLSPYEVAEDISSSEAAMGGGQA